MRLFAILALLLAASMSSNAARNSLGGAGSVHAFLERQGFCGSALNRRFGNHLFATTMINGRRSALMIDSGCPITVINRASAKSLGLRVRETRRYIGGVTGIAKRYGISNVSALAMGNCTFVNVPVEVAEEDEINLIARPHLDGLFGAHEMARFGMIIDCGRQMIYTNPRGPSAQTSRSLANFLTARGFTRIPMRFNADKHLEIDARVNGRPVRLIVDTGAATTLVSARLGAITKFSKRSRGMAVGYADLSLGQMKIDNAEVMVASVAKMVGAGLLGEEYLSINFGIVDVGGLALYLRPPDAR